MKKIAVVLAFAAATAMAGVARAQDVHVPNFGISPYDGSYWNGPTYDYNVGVKGAPQGRSVQDNAYNALASAPPAHHRSAQRPGS